MNQPIYDRDELNGRDCPEGLIGCPESYDPHRPPREDCALCWRIYNLEHDLPEGNRTARSSYKPSGRDPAGHYTRWLPEARPLEGTADDSTASGQASRAIREHGEDLPPPAAMGLDLSLTSAGVCVVFGLGGDEMVAATCTAGFSLQEGASNYDRQNRLHKIAGSLVDVYESARWVDPDGDHFPVAVEDHAYSRNTNQTARLHELHGAAKLQLYLHRKRRPVIPIGIGTARSDVWGNGSADVDDIRDVARDAGMAWLADEVCEDEMEAFSIAATAARMNLDWNTPG